MPEVRQRRPLAENSHASIDFSPICDCNTCFKLFHLLTNPRCLGEGNVLLESMSFILSLSISKKSSIQKNFKISYGEQVIMT